MHSCSILRNSVSYRKRRIWKKKEEERKEKKETGDRREDGHNTMILPNKQVFEGEREGGEDAEQL